MSATTRAIRTNLVRGGYGFKSAEGKKEPGTGMEKERRTKWDKRYFILADVNPPAVFWFKNESAYMADKEPKGSIPLDMGNVQMEDGEDKFEGQTILTLNSPDRNLIMRFMNRPGFETEGADWFSDVEMRCASGDVVSNAVKIQARFRARPEQRMLGEAKANAATVQAMARGAQTRKKLQQQEVPVRVTRIVEAMDTDDSGVIDVEEISTFFETMQLIDGNNRGKPPKLQAQEIVQNLADDEDATNCSAADLHQFLTKQFMKHPGPLQKIEKSMLLIPIGSRVVVKPTGKDAASPMWKDWTGQQGELLSYYNESCWCYVQLDGPAGRKPFKTDVIQALTD